MVTYIGERGEKQTTSERGEGGGRQERVRGFESKSKHSFFTLWVRGAGTQNTGTRLLYYFATMSFAQNFRKKFGKQFEKNILQWFPGHMGKGMYFFVE